LIDTAAFWVAGKDCVFDKPCSILPVKLIEFASSYNSSKNTIDLSWKTTQEHNSKSFIIERSTDEGGTFVEIGHIAAAGHSSTIKKYHFTDITPVEGFNLYRLKQTDLDDRFEYSKIVFVQVRYNDAIHYSTYPNPAKGSAYISTNVQKRHFINLQLCDGAGRILKQQAGNLSWANPIYLDLMAVNPGIYYLRIIGPETQKTHRLVVN
jgi:hypothetical protein